MTTAASNLRAASGHLQTRSAYIGLPLVSVTSGDPDQPDVSTLAPHQVPPPHQGERHDPQRNARHESRWTQSERPRSSAARST